MSTDYDICCLDCNEHTRLGQRFASMQFLFGYGTTDEAGRANAGEFIMYHSGHRLVVNPVPVRDWWHERWQDRLHE